MIELISTIVITASSVVLFAYWFRYTCLLILSAKTAKDYASEVASMNNLGFPEVQAKLNQTAPSDLDRLRASLDRDYRIVRGLLKFMPASAEGHSLETRMLAINYRLMGAWFRVSHRFSADTAVSALAEMSMVISHLANLMGEQAACAA